MSSSEEKISQFKDVTGCSDDRARFFLESANWTLQLALSSFFENQSDGQEVEAASVEMDREIESLEPESAPPSNSSSTGAMQKSQKEDNSFKKTNKPKIATLHNMVQIPSDDEEEGQAFYAGGSERSGQQVLGPPKRKNFKEELMEMLRMAHENGAVVDPSTQPTTSSSRELYQGIGLRLGQTQSDHTVSTEGPSRPQNIGPVMLKLWSQGFSINDGELRPYDEPENREFLESVMRGQVPNELRQMGNVVSVDLEDRRHEDFNKPPANVKTFKGSGHTLGSPAPSVEASTPATSISSANKEDNEKKATEQLNINESEPTTTIQIRLADGTRLSARFNLAHSIGDVRQYIITARPQYEGRTFVLVTAFPTKELSDTSETIANAGISNAVLMQRLK